jgi:hypothetical protein
MPRLFVPLAALGAGALAALVLASCGGKDAQLLPGETAREITANLDTVKQLTDEGDCLGAESAVQQVEEQIEALEGVDRKLKQALEGGAGRLSEVIAECEEATTEAIAPATVPSEVEGEEDEEPKEKKEKEKKPKDEGKAPEEPSSSPSLPPQAKGEGKGLENGNGPPSSEEGEGDGEVAPSGGVGAGEPAGEGD